MELTWIAIAASLAMGSGAAFLFIFAVKRDWMKNLEDAKYQVFWTDAPKSKQGSKQDGGQDMKRGKPTQETADGSQSQAK